MKNHKNTSTPSIITEHTNHHANPSRMTPEVEAMRGNEQTVIKKLEPHALLNPNKGKDVKIIHTNGSTTSDRL